ncbi:DMT family transporter [Oenococcus sp. UCMA 16435]|nr:DMT family transporter [Oenococcus sp. UCMA 16435]MDI4584174.1 EamA-like transporter family protein [Oenococcus sp. UCMA 14587]MDN6967134.1 DMT family transporter [Oenococcus sp. UCMA 17063]
MFSIIIGLSIGIGLPMQTAINSRLRNAFSSPLLSSMTSFTIGAIFLAIVTLLATHSLGVSASLIKSQPWWIWIGGLLGVIYLTGNILLFPHLGGVQTVIMPIVGQIIMSMLIDNFGWFNSPIHVLNIIRILGAFMVLVGVFLAISAQKLFFARKEIISDNSVLKNPEKNSQWFWRISGVITGMFSASQTAINGHLGTVLNSAVKAAFVSFLIGAIALWIIVAVVEHGYHFAPAFTRKFPWWIWIGGLIGALFVLGNAYLVPLIGTGFTVVIVLLGQIVGSMLVDQFGWFAAKRNPIIPVQVLGIISMIIGIALIKLF